MDSMPTKRRLAHLRSYTGASSQRGDGHCPKYIQNCRRNVGELWQRGPHSLGERVSQPSEKRFHPSVKGFPSLGKVVPLPWKRASHPSVKGLPSEERSPSLGKRLPSFGKGIPIPRKKGPTSLGKGGPIPRKSQHAINVAIHSARITLGSYSLYVGRRAAASYSPSAIQYHRPLL